ncbi:MAG: hypothetical protein SGILL_006718, partial [Bacillariaceae sp.]
TPPTFSDHIAVSLLLDAQNCDFHLTLAEKDKATKQSQPHKKTKTISSFFAAAPANKAGSITRKKPASGSTSTVAQSKRKKTMLDMMRNASGSSKSSSKEGEKRPKTSVSTKGTNGGSSVNARRSLTSSRNSKAGTAPKNSIRNFFK